jgi:hypothetical protein
MTARHKHLVKLIRQGIRRGNEDAPQGSSQAPTKWTLIRETAIKQYRQDAVFEYMGRLAQESIEGMHGPQRKANVKKGECLADEPLGEIWPEPCRGKIENQHRPGHRHRPTRRARSGER